MSRKDIPYTSTELKLIKTADLCRDLRSKLPVGWQSDLDRLVYSLQYVRIGIKKPPIGEDFDFYLRYYFDDQIYKLGTSKNYTHLTTHNFDDIIFSLFH